MPTPGAAQGLKAKAHKEDTWRGAGGVGAGMRLDKPQLVTLAREVPLVQFLLLLRADLSHCVHYLTVCKFLKRATEEGGVLLLSRLLVRSRQEKHLSTLLPLG